MQYTPQMASAAWVARSEANFLDMVSAGPVGSAASLTSYGDSLRDLRTLPDWWSYRTALVCGQVSTPNGGYR